MSEIIYHNHHIIPKHAGGTDDPANLVKLTIPEHAEAHRVLWEIHGRIGDKLAWLLLSGQTTEGETLRRTLAKSPESRTKISRFHKGKSLCVEHRAKISAALKGRRRTPEHQAKITAAKTGKPHSQEGRMNIRKAMMGRHMSAEWRAKIGAAHKGKIVSAETRRRISNAAKHRRKRR